MITREVIANKCWSIEQLLTREECEELMEIGISEGIMAKTASGDVRHRNCCKVLLQDLELSKKMWDRVKGIVPEEFVIGDASASPPSGFQNDSVSDMEGTWRPSGVNTYFTLLYYESGGHFGPHRDSCVINSNHERSILTLTSYLTDRPKNHGGGTNFLRDEMDCPPVDEHGRIRSPKDCIEATVASDRAGKGLLFLHDLMHEGGALEVLDEDGSVDLNVRAEPKWILLTQVFYARIPSTAPELSPDQLEARRVLRMAEDAEISGDVPLAIKLYNKAYRLDRTLEGAQ